MSCCFSSLFMLCFFPFTSAPLCFLLQMTLVFYHLLPNSCCEGDNGLFLEGFWVWKGVQVKFCAPNAFVQKAFIAVIFIPSSLHSFLHLLIPISPDPFQPQFVMVMPLVPLLFLGTWERMQRVLVHVQINYILLWRRGANFMTCSSGDEICIKC